MVNVIEKDNNTTINEITMELDKIESVIKNEIYSNNKNYDKDMELENTKKLKEMKLLKTKRN